MATLDVIDLDNRKVGTIELADALVNASLENADALFYETVKAQLASRRAGTHAVKNRSLVSGGGKKPWRQKGTGRARQGTIRAPQFAGGGVTFAPSPRDFSVKVNRKALRAALRAALSDHAQAGTLGLVAGDSFEKPSTKQAVEQLFDVHVVAVNVVKVQPKPKRRGLIKGTRPGWKKAIVEVKAGEKIDIFEGAQL